MPPLFERKRLLKLDSALVLADNEVGEVTSLLSCHVCVIRIKTKQKTYTLMSHYRVTDTAEHVAAVRSILYNGLGLNWESSPAAVILLFRLSSVQLVKLDAPLGTVYHIDKYEEATKTLEATLRAIFKNLVLREISYGNFNKSGCWIKVNTKKGMWESSFGHGLIEEATETHCRSVILPRQGGT